MAEHSRPAQNPNEHPDVDFNSLDARLDELLRPEPETPGAVSDDAAAAGSPQASPTSAPAPANTAPAPGIPAGPPLAPRPGSTPLGPRPRTRPVTSSTNPAHIPAATRPATAPTPGTPTVQLQAVAPGRRNFMPSKDTLRSWLTPAGVAARVGALASETKNRMQIRAENPAAMKIANWGTVALMGAGVVYRGYAIYKGFSSGNVNHEAMQTVADTVGGQQQPGEFTDTAVEQAAPRMVPVALERPLEDDVPNPPSTSTEIPADIDLGNIAPESVTLDKWSADNPSKNTVWGVTMDYLGNLGVDTDKLSEGDKRKIVGEVLRYNDLTWDEAKTLEPGFEVQRPSANAVADFLSQHGIKYDGKLVPSIDGSQIGGTQEGPGQPDADQPASNGGRHLEGNDGNNPAPSTTPTPSPSAEPSASASPSASATPSPAESSATPTASPSAEASASPSPEASPSPTVSASPETSPSGSASPSPSESAQQTAASVEASGGNWGAAGKEVLHSAWQLPLAYVASTAITGGLTGAGIAVKENTAQTQSRGPRRRTRPTGSRPGGASRPSGPGGNPRPSQP